MPLDQTAVAILAHWLRHQSRAATSNSCVWRHTPTRNYEDFAGKPSAPYELAAAAAATAAASVADPLQMGNGRTPPAAVANGGRLDAQPLVDIFAKQPAAQLQTAT